MQLQFKSSVKPVMTQKITNVNLKIFSTFKTNFQMENPFPDIIFTLVVSQLRKTFLNTCLACGLGMAAPVMSFNTSGPPNSDTLMQRIFVKIFLKTVRYWWNCSETVMGFIQQIFNISITNFDTLTHLLPMHLFSTPWKHQKTIRFSDAFRG